VWRKLKAAHSLLEPSRAAIHTLEADKGSLSQVWKICLECSADCSCLNNERLIASLNVLLLTSLLLLLASLHLFLSSCL